VVSGFYVNGFILLANSFITDPLGDAPPPPYQTPEMLQAFLLQDYLWIGQEIPIVGAAIVSAIGGVLILRRDSRKGWLMSMFCLFVLIFGTEQSLLLYWSPPTKAVMQDMRSIFPLSNIQLRMAMSIVGSAIPASIIVLLAIGWKTVKWSQEG